jgi:hypothetical protein
MWKTSFRAFLLFAALLSIYLALRAAWGVLDAVFPSPHPNSIDLRSMVVGKMGDSKLAIPSEYLLGPIAYKGVDIWNADSYKNRPQHPTYDNQLDSFAIRIRQNDFKPIENVSDEQAFRESYESVRKLPRSTNRWILVGFDARHYPIDPANVVAERWHQMYEKGPFDREADVWGLAHYVSEKLPSKDVTNGGGIQFEYFYDERQNSTFIDCQNTLRKVPPYDPISFCEIWFNAPEIRAQVNIGNIRDRADLGRWREIKIGVLHVVHSFIVP